METGSIAKAAYCLLSLKAEAEEGHALAIEMQTSKNASLRRGEVEDQAKIAPPPEAQSRLPVPKQHQQKGRRYADNWELPCLLSKSVRPDIFSFTLAQHGCLLRKSREGTFTP